MPATGRLYDPGSPTALEAALAQQLASGQTPFAGALLSSYGLQRQQSVEAVNEAQAQSHLLDLANTLKQQRMQSASSLAGAGLSSGRGIEPTLGAANSALGLGMDQRQISDAAAQADLANSLNMAKVGAETANLGSEAGGGVADTSPLLAKLGFGITPTSTPRGIQQSTIAANATMGAAREHSRSALEVAKIRGAGGGGGDKGSMIELSGTTPETGEAYKYRVTPDKATPAVQRAIAKNSANTATVIEHNSAGSALTPSGDAIQNDPELPVQITQIIKQHPGYHLVNDNGDPHDVTDANGKVLYREFMLIDRNGNQVPARVTKLQ
jgi:hypothetical protein